MAEPRTGNDCDAVTVTTGKPDGRAVRVAKNSLALMGASAAAKLGSLWVVGYLASTLGAGQYGLYQSSMAFAALFSILGHMGLNTLVVREVARNRGEAGRLLGATVLLKLALMVLVALCVGSFVAAGVFERTESRVVLVALSVFFFDNILGTVRAGLQAFERMGVQAALELGRKVLAWVAGIAVVYLGFKALGLAFAALGSAVASLVVGLVALRPVTRLRFDFERSLARELMIAAIPLGVTSMLALVLGKIDVVMLDRIAGHKSAGVYTAALAYQPIFLVQGIVWAVYPALARMAEPNWAPLTGGCRSICCVSRFRRRPARRWWAGASCGIFCGLKTTTVRSLCSSSWLGDWYFSSSICWRGTALSCWASRSGWRGFLPGLSA